MNMNARELRIGNYIKCNGEIVEVTYHRIRLIAIEYTFNGIPLNYEPILLTAELLEKCGFKNRGKLSVSDGNVDGTAYSKDAILIVLDQKSNKFYYAETYDTEYGSYQIEIKYLHKLQNLFFVLTEEELKVEL